MTAETARESAGERAIRYSIDVLDVAHKRRARRALRPQGVTARVPNPPTVPLVVTWIERHRRREKPMRSVGRRR